MFTFIVVLFFGATGILLNHPEWTFGIKPTTTKSSGTLERAWLTGEKPDWLKIEGFLRAKGGVHGIAGEDQADDREASFRFSAPAYTADVTIDRKTGSYTVQTESQGLIAVLNDLHRGKDSGQSWAWTIDLSGAFLCILSITGFGMIFFLKKVRFKALLTIAAGIALTIVLIKLAT